MKRARGFTITEMLVVVVIILVMVSASISILSVFMKGQSIKQAGRLMNAQFMQARQRSTSEKVVYFIHFDTSAGKQTMTLYKDTNLSRLLEIGTDERVGDEHPLVKTIEFETSVAGSLMASAAPIYIRFYPDGSCILPVPEKTYDPDVALTADVILIQPGQTHKLYLDISPASGKLRKQAYRVN